MKKFVSVGLILLGLPSIIGIGLGLQNGFSALSAQKVLYGIKTGLTFAQINGPSENVGTGDLEEWSRGTGFQIGATFSYELNPRMGINSELLFTQRGGNYIFGQGDDQGGPSYYEFVDDGVSDVAFGERRVVLSVVNSYIDIPLMFYYRIGDALELSVGGYVGFLITSRADGELVFDSEQIQNNSAGQSQFTNENRMIIRLDYDYNRDTPTSGVDSDLINTLQVVRFNGTNYQVPSIQNAYHELDNGGQRYNGFDAGLNFGGALTFGRGLILGLRFNFGLVDVTDDEIDVSYTEINGTSNVFRSDNDRNRSFELSLGFRF